MPSWYERRITRVRQDLRQGAEGLYKACRRELILSEESFHTLIKAAVYDPDPTGPAEPDDAATVGAEWYETALREFVSNEHLDVRRCILPGLPLRKSGCPPELHDLVDAAVAIARSHPDEYIRHRVEHQVGD